MTNLEAGIDVVVSLIYGCGRGIIKCPEDFQCSFGAVCGKCQQDIKKYLLEEYSTPYRLNKEEYDVLKSLSGLNKGFIYKEEERTDVFYWIEENGQSLAHRFLTFDKSVKLEDIPYNTAILIKDIIDECVII